MIKSLKTHVMKICCEEYGHLVMLAMFDGVDDTKLVQKAILDVRFLLNSFKYVFFILRKIDMHTFHSILFGRRILVV